MATFRFRLTTLKRLREAARDERRAQLAEAYRAQEMLREQSQQKRDELAALREMYSDAAAPGQVQVDRLVTTQRFELVLHGDLRVLEEQSRLLAEEVERRRLALVEADRQLRVLEKLEEKQQQRFHYEQQQAQVKLLDEVASRQARPWEAR